jgi:hypothetical protein
MWDDPLIRVSGGQVGAVGGRYSRNPWSGTRFCFRVKEKRAHGPVPCGEVVLPGSQLSLVSVANSLAAPHAAIPLAARTPCAPARPDAADRNGGAVRRPRA